MKSILHSSPRRFLHRLRNLALPTALILASVSPAPAQDKVLLDKLVQRGLLTQADADAVAKSEAVIVTPRDKAVKKLQLEGLLQLQYDWINTQDNSSNVASPPSTNQFIIRRAYFGALADLGNGWGGELVLDLASTGGGQVPAAPQNGSATQQIFSQNLFEKVIITKNVDGYGLGTVGFQKVQFGQEENTSVSTVKPVERSLTMNFFTGAYGGPTSGRLGWGNRRVGLFWNGTVSQVDGLYYGVSLTNGIQSTTAFGYPSAGVGTGSPSYNQFAGWLNLGYQNKYGNLTYRFGVNTGYSGDGNDTQNFGPTAPAQGNSVWGWNPYVTLTYQQFQVSAEFIQAEMQGGRSNFPNYAGLTPGGGAVPVGYQTSTAAPYGFIITPSYKINDQWELVGRYSYLSTNGRGVNINNIERNAPNVNTLAGAGAAGSNNVFDNVWALYAGVNYYIIGNSLKISLGYEFVKFQDRLLGTTAGSPANFSGPSANVSAVRTQIQLLF